MSIEPGAQARVSYVVTEADTAKAVGTGAVEVLATSRVLTWCERASFEVARQGGHLGHTTVAMRVHIDHIRAVGVGRKVAVIATLERLEGRRYIFVVSMVEESGEMVASGRIVRVAVDTAAFLARSGVGQSDQTSSTEGAAATAEGANGELSKTKNAEWDQSET